MHQERFAAVVRALGHGASRRGVLGVVAGMVGLGSGGWGTQPVTTATDRPEGKGRREGRRRGRHARRVAAQAKTKPGNHCISPLGIDLNAVYGIAAQIVAPFCQEVGSGQPWLVVPPWFMAHRFEAVPDEFEPTGETPLEDFRAKFMAVKYAIDPNSKQEKTVVFPNDDPLFSAELAVADGLVRVVPGTHDPLHPLSVGAHTVDIAWVFRAMHCDGLETDTTPGRIASPPGKPTTWRALGSRSHLGTIES